MLTGNTTLYCNPNLNLQAEFTLYGSKHTTHSITRHIMFFSLLKGNIYN